MSISDPTIGEIAIFAGNFAPRSWAFCDGQLISVSANPTLYSIIGTTYGGNGVSTFALPDLRGRFPLHVGQGAGPGLRGYREGEKGGHNSVTMTVAHMAQHTHMATMHSERSIASVKTPNNTMLGGVGADGDPIYAPAVAADNVPMHPDSITVGTAGGSQPMDITNPFLGVQFIIALEGIYPSRG